MTHHLKSHPKDHHSRLGLMGMLAARKRLLKYLRRTDPDSYGALLARLSLKDTVANRS
jgi:small subunit ribosomal protein S15